MLQALSSSASDHAPLHLSMNDAFRPKKRFIFEMFWLKLEGFDDDVKEAWKCDPTIVDPFWRLDALFRNVAESLRAWGQRKAGNIKLQLAIANTVIFRLDVAQERRLLSPGERWLRKTLKLVVGLASLERTIARQRSRIRWLERVTPTRNSSMRWPLAVEPKTSSHLYEWERGSLLIRRRRSRHSWMHTRSCWGTFTHECMEFSWNLWEYRCGT
jgi:hypothetical protein